MNTSRLSPVWLASMAANGDDIKEPGRSQESAAAARYTHTHTHTHRAPSISSELSSVGLLIVQRVLIP